MTWVKKLKNSWEPQEHPGIQVGDHVDFPGSVEALLREGSVSLCDEDGNELSAYDQYGIVTDEEMGEFRAWKKMKQQEALKKSLEKERDQLLQQAELLKKTPVEKPVEEKKKSDFGERMAAARAVKKAERDAKASA